MFFSTAATLAAASLAAAAPSQKRATVFKSTVKKTIAPDAKSIHVLQSDLARIANFRAGKSSVAKRQEDSDAINGVISYLAEVQIGDGGSTYDLIIDTGSSNTWAKKFKVTSDAQSTGDSVSVSYGTGSFSGTEYTADVTVADGLTIQGQGVGRATKTSDFDDADGILGVGPTDLTEGTVSGEDEVPTVVDNAASQGLIPAAVLGVYFAPATSNDQDNGALTWGGTDSSLYAGSITYQSVSSSGSSAEYWGLSITSNLGSKRSGIVDTGTTLVYLPTSWYNTWFNAIPSATVNSDGYVQFPKSSLSSVPDITFTIGGKSFKFNKYAQLVETELYSTLGFSSSYYYAWVGDSGDDSDLAFILGQKFLERYYSVYDTDNNRIGFATTANSNPTSVP